MKLKSPLIMNGTIFFLLLSVVLLTACSTTFKLPPKSPKMETVYLIKYTTWGHHSLAFYHDGLFTEFTYGDWELFALNKRDSWTAWKNMTFFTQGALGRKSVFIKPGELICDQFKGCENVVPFKAPADKVKWLWNMLQSNYDSSIMTEVYNSEEGVNFVKYDKAYWFFHNCNHELVSWLEVIDGNVSGRVFYKPLLIDGMEPKQQPIKSIP